MDILDHLTIESGHIARSEIDIAGMSPTVRSPALALTLLWNMQMERDGVAGLSKFR